MHGGGPAISAFLKKTGKESTFVNGLRVTDQETMEIAEMVLGRVSKNLVTLVESLGVKAVGISGKDGGLLTCRKRLSDGHDIGFISRISVSDAKKLIDKGLIGGGMLPKLSNCTSAITGGVNRVHILDGRVPHSILLEIFTNKGNGTMFYDDTDQDAAQGQQ